MGGSVFQLVAVAEEKFVKMLRRYDILLD